MTYTKADKNLKFFLNDKNIAQELKYGDIQINAIPSLDLVSSLYNELSTEDKRQNDYLVSVETSAYQISADVDGRLLELSNTLSTYSNKLCTEISNQVKTNRIDDKIELSSTLSTYTNNSVKALSNSLSNDIDTLSTNLSTEVNKIFVHLTGDSMTGALSIANNLTVVDDVLLKKNIHILNNLTQGKGSYVDNSIDRGIALGVSAIANQNDAFVWNGDYTTKTYNAQETGSFNINPRSGVSGFYIGDKNLTTIIHNDTTLSVNALTVRMNNISSALSNQIDTNRAADQSELSANFKDYTHSISSALSNQIDTNRAADYLSATNTANIYVQNLSTSLSHFISAAQYSVIQNTNLEYDVQKHLIKLTVSDEKNNSKVLSIDTTDFIKNRIVDHVDVVTEKQDASLTETVIRIWWTPDKEITEGVYTDIPISELAKVYTAGTGISIDDNLIISVKDYDNLTANVNLLTTNVDTISTLTIPGVYNRVSALETYAKKLSSTDIDDLGTIKIIENNLTSISSGISTVVDNILTNNIPKISSDISTNSVDISTLTKRVDSLKLSTAAGWVGDVPVLCGTIDNLRKEIRGAANYCGQIAINKYHPDWVETANNKCLSSLFKYSVLHGIEDTLKNGNIYELVFSELSTTQNVNVSVQGVTEITSTTVSSRTFCFSNPLYAADQYFDTEEGIRLAHNCFLMIASKDGGTQVALSDLTKDNITIINGDWYVPYQISVQENAAYAWRNGYNRLSSNVQLSIYKDDNDRNPRILSAVGHAISGYNDIGGYNHFLDGSNIFDGFNSIEKLSVYALSVNSISADNISARNLSIGNDVNIQNQLSVAKKVNFLSGNFTISANSVNTNYATKINSTLNVTSAANFDNSVSISSNLTVKNVLTADTNPKKKTLYVENEEISGQLSVNTNVNFLSGNVTITSADGIKSNYKVTISNDVEITGTSKLSGNLSVGNVLTVDTSSSTLTVDNTLTVATASSLLSVKNISAGSLSIDWDKLVHTTGYSLQDLSDAVSNKIYIEDQVDESDSALCGTSDLSILKMKKEDFDELVALKRDTMSSNTLYIVDSDYIDAYGEQLCNLTMTNDDTPSEATNKHYVDVLCANLSTDISTLSINLSTDISTLSINLSTDISTLSINLSTDISTLSTNLSTDISALSTSTRNVFCSVYNKISSINCDSTYSNVVQAIIDIKDILSTHFNFAIENT